MNERPHLSEKELLCAAAVSLVGLAIVLATAWVIVLLVSRLGRELF